MKTPQVTWLSPRLDYLVGVPLLIDFLKRPAGEVYSLSFSSAYRTLDIVYAGIINEQRYTDFITRQHKVK